MVGINDDSLDPNATLNFTDLENSITIKNKQFDICMSNGPIAESWNSININFTNK